MQTEMVKHKCEIRYTSRIYTILKDLDLQGEYMYLVFFLTLITKFLHVGIQSMK